MSNFAAGFVSSLGGSYTGGMRFGARIFAAAALGGTASLLSGGKFANGAITGAFVVLFNHLQTHNKSGINSDLEEYGNESEAYTRQEKLSKDNDGNEVAGYHLRKYNRDGTFEDLYLVDPESAKYSDQVEWSGEKIYDYKKAGYQVEGLSHTHSSDPFGSTDDMRSLYSWGQTNGGNIYLDAITNGEVYRYNFNVVNRTGSNGNYKCIMAPRPMAAPKVWSPDRIFRY